MSSPEANSDTPLASAAHIAGKARFLGLLTDALTAAGLPPGDRSRAASRLLSEVETEQLTAAAVRDLIAAAGPRIAELLSDAAGRLVQRVLVAPVSGYAQDLIPWLLSAGLDVTLADNFKAGTQCAGLSCVTLDEALDAPAPYDAVLLGTIDHVVGQMFRDRLPAECTLSFGDLAMWHGSATVESSKELAEFLAAVRNARNPLVFLAGFLDTTLIPTLEALAAEGYDVFTITRVALGPDAGHARTRVETLRFGCHAIVGFSGMLSLLEQIQAPVIVNYARFLANRWDLRWSIPPTAYGIALLAMLRGPRLLLLYDVALPGNRGHEAEIPAFTLYRRLLDTADGIIVGSEGGRVLADLIDAPEKILCFLRYGKEAATRLEMPEGPFRMAVISHFLGEFRDATRTTVPLIESLLRQQIHLHYYVDSPEARQFRDGLTDETRAYFHLHPPILDQQTLVDEIARYHAGWFVIDAAMLNDMASSVTTPLAKTLFSTYAGTAIATACLVYAAAGLPIFLNPINKIMYELCAEGTVLSVAPEEIDEVGAVIARTDWAELRRRAFAHRQHLTIGMQIGRLTRWIAQITRTSAA